MSEFHELSKANEQRCKTAFGHNVTGWAPAEWCLAVCGEAGELANLVKKLELRHEPINPAMIESEMADIVIYLDLFAQSMGMNLRAAVMRKFNEVSAKKGFPELRLDNGPHGFVFVDDRVSEPRGKQIMEDFGGGQWEA